MPSTVIVTTRTEKKVKEQAQKLAKKLGVPLSTIINGFLRQFIRDKAIYFSAEPTYKMSKELEKTLDEVEKDIRLGRNISPKFDNMKDALDYLKHAKIEE